MPSRVAALEHKVGRLVVRSRVIGADVRIDGAPVGRAPLAELELNPGRHAVEVTKEGYESFRGEVLLVPDQTGAIEASPIEHVRIVRIADRPLYKRWWVWTIVGGVVVVGAVTGGVLGSRARADDPLSSVMLPPVSAR